jgi:hypothetical protein
MDPSIRRWTVANKFYIKIVLCGGVNWVHLAEDMGFSWTLVNPIIFIWLL